MLAVGEYMFEDFNDRFVCISTGFGGGVAGTREELCGALSAGVMVIGGVHGRSAPGEDQSRAYEIAKDFRQKFISRWGASACRPIRDWAQSPEGPGNCRCVVEESTRLLVDVLAEQR